MALTIEDGTGVADANSYATVAQAREYADARALDLPAEDEDVEALLVKACDYLESLERKFKGSRTDADQALAWPRSDVFLFSSDEAFPDDEIPSALVRAQCQLAFDCIANDLQPTGSGQEVLREKVDVIEVQYGPGGGNVIPDPAKALAILEPLLTTAGLTLKTMRA